jgi:hypothetical protein
MSNWYAWNNSNGEWPRLFRKYDIKVSYSDETGMLCTSKSAFKLVQFTLVLKKCCVHFSLLNEG